MTNNNKLEIKNLKANENGTIDLELNHPVYGWIPFTASPGDCEEHGRIIHKEALEGKYGAVAPYLQ